MPHANPRVYYVGNSMLAELTDLKDEVTSILLPAATVTAWLVTPTGTTVTDSLITLNVVAPGHYQGIFPYTLVLTPDVAHTCRIRAETGNPLQRAEWVLPILTGVRYG